MFPFQCWFCIISLCVIRKASVFWKVGASVSKEYIHWMVVQVLFEWRISPLTRIECSQFSQFFFWDSSSFKSVCKRLSMELLEYRAQCDCWWMSFTFYYLSFFPQMEVSYKFENWSFLFVGFLDDMQMLQALPSLSRYCFRSTALPLCYTCDKQVFWKSKCFGVEMGTDFFPTVQKCHFFRNSPAALLPKNEFVHDALSLFFCGCFETI